MHLYRGSLHDNNFFAKEPTLVEQKAFFEKEN